MVLPFDRFVRYDEFTEALHTFADEHSDLVSLEQYGTSFEGRALWLVTITDPATGPHSAKPAYWVDANIHSVEVTGGAAALHLLHFLAAASERGEVIRNHQHALHCRPPASVSQASVASSTWARHAAVEKVWSAAGMSSRRRFARCSRPLHAASAPACSTNSFAVKSAPLRISNTRPP